MILKAIVCIIFSFGLGLAIQYSLSHAIMAFSWLRYWDYW